MLHAMMDFYRYLQGEQSQAVLAGLLAASALLSALLATGFLYQLPHRNGRHDAAVWLLLFGFGVFIPVAGTLGLGAALLAGRRRRARVPVQRFEHVASPRFDPLSSERSHSDARDRPRDRLEQSVVALQHMPSALTSPILRQLLADSTDDIRMMAFGMLDCEEKKIARRIRDLLKQLAAAESAQERFRCSCMLAELYWEMDYAGMVQGDLRRYTLELAEKHATNALVTEHAGLLFLLARIKDGQGNAAEAEQYLQRSTELGLPLPRVVPYLAELAFKRMDFAAVRALMSKLADAPVTQRLHPVVEYWTHNHAGG